MSDEGEVAERGIAAVLPLVVGVTLAVGAGMSYAFVPTHAGQPIVLITLGATYALLLALGAIWLHRHDEVKRLMPQRGDITIGALLAVGTYLVSVVAHFAFTASGKPGEPWLFRIYLQIGDPEMTTTFAVGLAVLAIAAAEEVVWRGWVQTALSEALSPRSAVIATAALYAAAHLPTAYLLRDPDAGFNPLLVAAAAGFGLIWGMLTMRVERVMPSVFAHALFTWAVVEYPIWRM